MSSIQNIIQKKKKIKWYPKFAALYNNNDNNEIVNNFIDFINLDIRLLYFLPFLHPIFSEGLPEDLHA